jgi:ribose 1,5-bisphosphokinase
MSGRFIAIVGPSGVGKDSVMQALLAHDPRFKLARRIITRPSDAGGEDFDGVSELEFFERETAGDFALSWPAHGLHYAIPADVDALLNEGFDVLANLSRSVLTQANTRFGRFNVINLTAKRATLAKRLAARGRETAEQIALRLDRVATLPKGIKTHEIDNSGALADTVQAVMACLYPVKE